MTAGDRVHVPGNGSVQQRTPQEKDGTRNEGSIEHANGRRNENGFMSVSRRQDNLVDLVRRAGKVSVAELADALGASRETIRRDLTHLERAGRVQKVHGGAIIPRLAGEGSFAQRMGTSMQAKTAMARVAASLFASGETLFIDTGSTTLYLAEELAAVAGLTIVTNSTEIARTIARARNASGVFLLGGAYGVENSQTLGTMAASQIRSFRAHHAVLTVGALDSRTGAMDFDMEEAQVAQAMIGQSEQVTVLADSSKFESLASFEVCPLARIDRLVCDSPPPADIRDGIEQAGGTVIIAQ